MKKSVPTPLRKAPKAKDRKKVKSVKAKEENFIDFERQREEKKYCEGKNPFLEREKSIGRDK